ncbi:unnamed protein product [Sphagnum tenellum]
MKKPIISAALIGISSFSLGLIALNGWAIDSGNNSNQKPQVPVESETLTVTPVNKVTPREAQAMSSDAVSVLRHVVEARGFIRDNYLGLAKDELNQGLALLDVIRSQMPEVKIKDRIAIAQKHLQFNETQKVTDDLVPLYSDLTYVESLVPSQEIKVHLDKAKEGLKSGNRQQAMNELQAAQESITYTEVDLPLAETLKNLKLALLALNQNRPKAAERALIEIENRLQANFDTLIEDPIHSKAGNNSAKN